MVYVAFACGLAVKSPAPASHLYQTRPVLPFTPNLSPVKRARTPYACTPADEETSPEDIGLERQQDYLKMLREVTEAETALSNPLGTKMSYEIIRFEEDGIGPLDRYVYVEEQDCIGCTHCATTASNTFFLESMFGRARVFDQLGDSEELVAEAISTCPVNCIYYVDWEDLVTLEQNRKTQKINNWSRLVGGQDASNSRKSRRRTKVMDSGIMRCEDCPGRGCATCPLYGVGQNPEYLKKKAIRQAKLQEKKDLDRKRGRRRVANEYERR
ncbi:unnamed protein product [Agarophyton chilense]